MFILNFVLLFDFFLTSHFDIKICAGLRDDVDIVFLLVKKNFTFFISFNFTGN
jgi:hypothetical protein